jgi:hypothetical protein
MNSPTTEDDGHAPSADIRASDCDLKFVAVDLGEGTAGGWYRELPDSQIEVLSRAQLERVPLVAADAETTAREKIAEIITRRSLSLMEGAVNGDSNASPCSAREQRN